MKFLSRFIIFILVALFIGCAHKNMLSRQSPYDFYSKINKSAMDRKCHIILWSNNKYIGNSVMVSKDSTFWNDPITKTKKTIATSSIKEIHIFNRAKGAKNGFRYGMVVVGLISGAFLGMSSGSGEISRDEASIYLLYSTLAGGIVGLPIGVIIWSKEKFIFFSKN